MSEKKDMRDLGLDVSNSVAAWMGGKFALARALHVLDDKKREEKECTEKVALAAREAEHLYEEMTRAVEKFNNNRGEG